MESMFNQCVSLTSVTFPDTFGGNGVTTTKDMYKGCVNLQEIQMTGVVMGAVTTMESMFDGCYALATLGQPAGDSGQNMATPECTNMARMFKDCRSLTDIDLSTFDTSGVVGTSGSAATGFQEMFQNCHALRNIDTTYLKVQGCANLKGMFQNCLALDKVDLYTWTLAPNTDASSMFAGSEQLTTILVSSNWNQDSIAANTNMFDGCLAIKGASGFTYDSGAATPGGKQYAHVGIVNGTNGYLCAKHFVNNNVYWNLDSSGHLVLSPISGNYGELNSMGAATDTATTNPDATVSWYKCRDNIQTFEITGGTVGIKRDGYLNNMFAGCEKLTSCDLSNLATTNALGMYRMFYNCKSLTELDVTGFATTNVGAGSTPDTTATVSMAEMFYGCENLYGSIKQRDNDTGGKVEYKTLDLSSFNIPSVTTMRSMFQGCRSLEDITFAEVFSTYGVKDLSNLFYGCENLKTLDMTTFSTLSTETMTNMFFGCKNLESVNVTSFNVEKVKTMNSMFEGCEKLANVDITSFNALALTTMDSMFKNCTALSQVNMPETMNTYLLTDIDSMFERCTSLASIDMAAINVESVTHMNSVFAVSDDAEKAGYMSSLTSVNFSTWNLNSTPRGIDTDNMFYNCRKLVSVYAGADWKPASLATTGDEMFKNCSSIKGADGTEYQGSNNGPSYQYAKIGDTGYLSANSLWGDVYWMLDGAGDLRLTPANNVSGELGSFFTGDTTDGFVGSMGADSEGGDAALNTVLPPWYNCSSNIITFDIDDKYRVSVGMNKDTTPGWLCNMFAGCDNLESVDFSRFDTSGCGNMYRLFYDTESLTSVNLDNFETLEVTNMQQMFARASTLPRIDLETFVVSSVTTMKGMFQDCSSLGSVLFPEGFNPSAVTTMENMFAGCVQLVGSDHEVDNGDGTTTTTKMLDLSSFNTYGVTNMSGMFQDCRMLANVDLSSFDVVIVDTMERMFAGCTSLQYVDLRYFNPASCETMESMFEGCSVLTEIEDPRRIQHGQPEEHDQHVQGLQLARGHQHDALQRAAGGEVHQHVRRLREDRRGEHIHLEAEDGRRHRGRQPHVLQLPQPDHRVRGRQLERFQHQRRLRRHVLRLHQHSGRRRHPLPERRQHAGRQEVRQDRRHRLPELEVHVRQRVLGAFGRRQPAAVPHQRRGERRPFHAVPERQRVQRAVVQLPQQREDVQREGRHHGGRGPQRSHNQPAARLREPDQRRPDPLRDHERNGHAGHVPELQEPARGEAKHVHHRQRADLQEHVRRLQLA